MLTEENTEKMYFNRLLITSNFPEFIKKYKDVSIEIWYPSESFKLTLELLTKIWNKNLRQMKIGVIFTVFSTKFKE